VKSRLALPFALVLIGFACKPSTEIQSPAPPSPPPPDHAPVAVAGGPYNSATGTISVDGSQSSDPDAGDVLTFRWNFGDGTTGDSVKMSHTYQNDGNYNVSLIVTDNKGAKDTASTTAGIAIEHGAVLIGAGNIATCGTTNDDKTAQIIDALPNAAVFTTGDNVFEHGNDSEYVSCYGPSWGRFLSRTHPTLGNHDYDNGSSDGAGSFQYFGDRIPAGTGYYSYDVGTWHVIVLNDKGGTDPNNPGLDQAQMAWLQSDLDQHQNQKCTIAMWHVPLFQSSNTPNWTVNPGHKPIWDMLYAAGVEIVLNGQQHNYERFAPMTPAGDVDSTNGIREFNVGTGGESVDNFTVAIHPHSEVRAAAFGVLKLSLKPDSYDWQFVPIDGATFSDSGSGTCH